MREVFEILGQAPAPVEPGQGSFDDPSSWKQLEALCLVGPLDDLDRKLWHRRRGGVTELCPLIAGVGEELGQKGIFPKQRRQHKNSAVAILDVRRMDQGVQQQAYRVDQDMSLLALDLLACIIAGWIDRGPPFSALFTLWLSMTHAVGLASRSTCSRHFT